MVHLAALHSDLDTAEEHRRWVTWARLRAAKRVYDPANLFRVNNNIPAG